MSKRLDEFMKAVELMSKAEVPNQAQISVYLGSIAESLIIISDALTENEDTETNEDDV